MLEMKIGEVIDCLGVISKPLATREIQAKCKGATALIVAALHECEKRNLVTHPPGRLHGYVLTETGKMAFAGGLPTTEVQP